MRFACTGFALWAFACLAAAPPANQWPGWDTYPVIMWSTGAAVDQNQWIDRMRQIGITAEECTGCDASSYVARNFGFYVENLVPELAFFFSRQALYDADYAGYTATHDPKYLRRKPSLSDAAFWAGALPHLGTHVAPYVGQHPLMYQLRDELSIGRYANPMDYDFDPNALRDFRTWLQQQYGTLDALNREWETNFSSWDAVTPMTTYQIKDREAAALAAGTPENYAPWADHRAFMDLTFSQSLDRLRGYIRTLDNTRPVGVEGTQMPSAWDGFDLWRMSQAIDWVEAYNVAGSREIFRSFLPQGTPVVSTVFGSDFPRIRRELWWLLLHGNRGAIVWDDETSRTIQKDQVGEPVTDRGTSLAAIFTELKSVAPVIMSLQRLDDRIAIHYSQASIRAHWMFDSREDGGTWPKRFSSWDETHSRIARVRDSFMRVIEDLGLQYNFVSYEQIEEGELQQGGYKALLLPQSVAMSDAECRAIRSFVEAGGTVIADNMTATMDERGKRLSKGQLDDLFGIRRASLGWSPQPSGGSLLAPAGVAAPQGFEPDITVVSGNAMHTGSGVPVVIRNSFGAGRAIYLNLDMHNYGRYRLQPPAGDAIRNLFGQILKDSGIVPDVQVVGADGVSPVPCVEVWRYVGNGANYISVMRNPEFEAGALQQDVNYPDNSAIEKPVQARIIFASPQRGTNMRTGASVAGDSYQTTLDPWSPVILKLQAASGAAVTLVSPASGATFRSGNAVRLIAKAAAGGAGVKQIEFFQNGISIGLGKPIPVPPGSRTAAMAPDGLYYVLDWSRPPAGSYNLTARMTDSTGAVTLSSSITIVVN